MLVRDALAPVVEAVFPRSPARCAARAGILCAVLSGCAWLLFPASAQAGTEVPQARAVTAVALALAAGLFGWSGGRAGMVAGGFATLLLGAAAAPAWWLLIVAGSVGLYLAAVHVPRPAPDPVASLDPPCEGAQELVESLAMALVLALVVREFGFEAFKIPTGSMEPTILGDGRDRKGDRLLAFKPADYRRWDIVVFRFPLFRETNYIKRMIGLPGEELELRQGDVYVNGEIVPKPDDVQAVMWRTAFAPRPNEDWIRHFDPDARNAWVFREGCAEVDTIAEATTPADDVAWCQLRGGFEEDHRALFDVEVEERDDARAELAVSLEGARRHCELRVAADGARVTAPGGEWPVEGLSLRDLGDRFRLGFSASDRVCRVFVAGRQVASFRHPDTANGAVDAGTVRLGARGLRARLRNVAVLNDVQYGMSGATRWKIPPDGYVMLGDNTHSSRDSRYWSAHEIRTKDGRVFVAPERARVTEDREETVFHTLPDGGVEFLDSYGVKRRFTADEVESVKRERPQPYVHEDDLVGRAFLIFFPFPPAGDFRPRLLR